MAGWRPRLISVRIAGETVGCVTEKDVVMVLTTIDGDDALARPLRLALVADSPGVALSLAQALTLLVLLRDPRPPTDGARRLSRLLLVALRD